ncbi:LysR family transcriptional regulator [Motilimonas pumila]|nr:LysR family transcriptional regulator [Motilimonas pumila]
MKLDLNAAYVFAHVAKWGSFAEAARQLQMPSSSVSRLVQNLEQALAVKLLLRNTRHVKLTQAGTMVLQQAEQLIGIKETIGHISVSQHVKPQGLIRISAPQGFIHWPLGQWLMAFRQAYPDVDIDLVSSNRLVDLHQDKFDFAFRQGPLVDSNLVALKLVDLQYGVYASAELLQGKVISTPDELNDWPCINLTADTKVLPWLLQQAGKDRAYYPSAAMKFEDSHLAYQAAMQGLGCAFLANLAFYQTASYGQSPPQLQATGLSPLIPLLQEYWPAPVGFYMVYPERQLQAAKDKAFIAFIRQQMQSLNEG